MEQKFYIKFIHTNSEAENYDMQSKWFPTPKLAKDWFYENFDFVDDDVNAFLMTAEFTDEDSYDIVKSQRIKH